MAKKGPLSVWKTIVLHLSRFSRYSEEFEVPCGVTQEGVAEGCGISRAHAALELGKLKEKGMLAERLAHVRGARTKKKVYFLGEGAYKEALAMREGALRGRARFVTAAGFKELDGAAALQRLTGALGLSEARAIGILMAGGEIDEPRLAEAKPKPCSSAWPIPDNFVGREVEMESLKGWLSGNGRLAIVLGMQGIGKSSLTARAFADAGVPTMWHRASALDSAVNFAGELAKFAALPGFAFQGSRKPDAREVAAALGSDKKRRLVVIGGYSHAAMALDPFLGALVHGDGGLKIVLCCETKPSFYGVPETSGGSVAEFHLGGLDEDATAELLGKRGLSGTAQAKRLFELTGGHPMALALVKPGSDVVERDALRHLVRDVLGGLIPETFDTLAGYSVHRLPVPQSAVASSPAAVGALIRSGLLIEDSAGHISAHNVVRAAVSSCSNSLALKGFHSSAADYYLNADDPFERLHHLWKAGRRPEAARHLRMHRGRILAGGNVAESLAIAKDCCLGKSDDMDDLVAELAIAVGDIRTALEVSRRLSSSGSNEISSRARVRSARLMLRQGDLAGARLMLESSHDKCGAEGLRVLGGLERRSGEYEKAAQTLAKALSAAKKKKDWRLAGEASNELGVIALDLGDFTGARKWLEEAHGYAIKAVERADAAVIMANIALSMAQDGETVPAAKKLTEAMSAAKKAGLLRLEAAVATNLAHLQFNANDFKSSRRTGERAVELLDSLGDEGLIGAAQINLGQALVKLGDAGAEMMLESGIASSMKFPEAGLKGQRLAEAARGLAELGKAVRAKEVGALAAACLREVGDDKGALLAERTGEATSVRKK
jgi:tetratricopeptide (TPR) repeat protein